ncbi:MAG: gliding motility-associated C-terminal domain-containing protein [Flavobacteriaceae bacterium]|nr:gliding motility-associated C-terminal domain-containing protein [Flavobacteriaceae bacterium]
MKKYIKSLCLLFFVAYQSFAQTPPNAVNDVDTADINTTLIVNAPGLLVNDFDADGDTITVIQFIINGTTYTAGQTANIVEGSLTINADGSYTFIPTPGYTGYLPNIIYVISDGTSTSSALFLLTVERTTNLLGIEVLSSCNQGFTADGDYKIRYFIRLTNTSNARDYHPSSLITNIDLIDDLESVFGNDCVTLVDQISINTNLPDDYVGNPYPQDWSSTSLNSDFENIASNSIFNTVAITNNVLYPRQYINVSFCVTVNPFCNGRPNPTPSGSGIDFDNIVSVTSSIGSDTTNLNLTDFHTAETTVAANIFVPIQEPDVNPDGTYDFTNTVIITNDGSTTANNVNYNMGLGNFIDNGISFTTLTVSQVSGNPVTINNSFNGDTNTELLAPNQSLAAGETITLEVFYIVDTVSSQDDIYFLFSGRSMTQGLLDGFDESLANNKRRFSFVTWSDSMGDHLDRPYSGADATTPASSNNQCNCSSVFMRFLFTSSVTSQKTIASTNSAPNGIIEHEEITFQLTVTNTSSFVQIENLQLQDNLNNICTGSIVSVSTPTIVSSTAITNPTLNPSFNGLTDINIFNGTSGILEPNQNVTVEFTVVFNDDCIGTNIASFTANDPLNNVISSNGTVAVSVLNDNDNDGITNVNDIDDDNDTIPDTVEYNGLNPLDDADNDNIPNYRDTDFGVDSNNDGIVDLFDFDLDGVPNHFDLDSDNDGILDIVEASNSALDTDTNGMTNNSVGNNGLDNTIENNDTSLATITYTIPNTDALGNPDYLDIDADGDGIVDNIEGQSTDSYIVPNNTVDANGIDTAYPNGITPVDTENDTIFDYIDTNSDNDIRDDFIEGWDFNNDGTPETIAVNLDADNDGLDNAFDNDDTQINPSNGQTPTDFPNVDNTTTSERDWREIIAIQVIINDVTVIEGGDLIFTVSLTTMNDNSILISSASPVIIDLSTSDGTDTTSTYDVAITPFDYNQVTANTLTIPPFTSTMQFTVTTLDDNIHELDELLTLNGTVTSNNTINTDPKGIGTILDNEAPPNITMNNTRENEGIDLMHPITISYPSSTPIIIDISTSDIVAINPEDYTSINNTFTIDGTIDPANANIDVSFNITTVIDNLNEPDEETLAVIGQVTSSNVGLQDLDKIGIIVDINPDPLIIIDDSTVVEGNTLVFTLSLVNPNDNLPMLNYEVINFNVITSNGTAFSPNDYGSINATTTIPALTENIEVRVRTVDDNLNEDTETMSLFATVTSGNISNFSPILEGVGTILDNDIPNLFSPNGDGRSDTFAISGLQDFPNFSIKIFDRWGSEVYNYNNNGNTNPEWWDGTYKDNPVPVGVYYYNLDFNDGTTKPKVSFIELIR